MISFTLLIPLFVENQNFCLGLKVGELIGGSQREERFEVIRDRSKNNSYFSC